jgi:uncharacterized protein (TIGR03435 family)
MALGLATALVSAGHAQPVEQGQLAFEVASLKLSAPAARGSEDAGNGTLTIRNRSLRNLVVYAYDLDFLQVRGPAWIDEVNYDVFGKAAGPASQSQLKEMLQTLLAERVLLKVHRENRPVTMTVMTVGKSGPKGLTPVADGKSAIEFDKRVRVFRRFKMADFARTMGAGGSPTLDQTGLQGRFDFRLDVEKYLDPAAETGSMPAFVAAIRDAAEAELGMKFEVTKVSLEVLVIDHAERTPKPN